MQADALRYQSGFGSHFESEAVGGALPKGRNSPQRPAFGLYAEQLSGSAFTAPRHENRRSWLYRMRPTADHRPFERYEGARLFAPGTMDDPLPPNRLRWDPPADLSAGADFIDGIGDVVLARRGMGTSYHLSVVVDDAAQGITLVTRGEDLFDSTFIHVLLQRLLDLPTPLYHHHRLIRDAAGRRLAKRDDARAIRLYRAEGATPADIRRMVGLTG